MRDHKKPSRMRIPGQIAITKNKLEHAYAMHRLVAMIAKEYK